MWKSGDRLIRYVRWQLLPVPNRICCLNAEFVLTACSLVTFWERSHEKVHIWRKLGLVDLRLMAWSKL